MLVAVADSSFSTLIWFWNFVSDLVKDQRFPRSEPSSAQSHFGAASFASKRFSSHNLDILRDLKRADAADHEHYEYY